MTGDYRLPDEARRDKLETLEDALDRARSTISRLEREQYPGFEEDLSELENRLDGLLTGAREDLSDIPEWDAELVRDIVLDNAGGHDTTVERVDSEVVLRFSIGPMGDETECRYAVAATSGNEWFHVKRNGEWDEVWSN